MVADCADGYARLRRFASSDAIPWCVCAVQYTTEMMTCMEAWRMCDQPSPFGVSCIVAVKDLKIDRLASIPINRSIPGQHEFYGYLVKALLMCAGSAHEVREAIGGQHCN